MLVKNTQNNLFINIMDQEKINVITQLLVKIDEMKNQKGDEHLDKLLKFIKKEAKTLNGDVYQKIKRASTILY
jgi:hypothetical protein